MKFQNTIKLTGIIGQSTLYIPMSFTVQYWYRRCYLITHRLNVNIETMLLWIRWADPLHSFSKLRVSKVEVRERQHYRRV